jgi:glycosyltransferase involved in cell wall biosynthesis
MHSHAAGVDGAHRNAKEKIHQFFRTKLKHLGTQFVACSDLARQWMFPNIDAHQVLLIHNGVDLKKFRFDPEIRAQVRRELGLENAVVIGHVGRFAYQKNHTFLIRAFHAFKKKEPRAKLLLVGEGELMGEMRALTHELLLQAMDVFALPSHFEGLPIVGVEAQAAGLPVLFSDCITKEAKLTDDVGFLPIAENAETLWAGALLKAYHLPRKDNYQRLYEAGYDICYTVNQFLELYRGANL